jgi:MFS transporter, OFA family, oxalate/formate antiporter
MNNNTYVTISFFRGWLVTYSAAALGLIFGSLYIWSVIKSGIPVSWEWSNAEKALPYATMAIVFSAIMIPAGRMQDRYGPRPMIFFGGFLTGLGCIISGLGGASLLGYLVGFGIVTGIGVGVGYSALIPTAIKWFPREKTGLVTGIVVAGIGMAPVFLAPLTVWLLKLYSKPNVSGTIEMGVSSTMVSLGVVIWLVVFLLTWFVVNPPLGYTPLTRTSSENLVRDEEFDWKQMLSTVQFWLLFLMFFIGSSAGLVFIGVAADLGKEALKQFAFLTVVVLSLGNSAGRVIAGIISDRIGRLWTLFIDNLFQCAVIFVLYKLTQNMGISWWAILIIVFLIGMNYGGNQTIFPATCKDYFGIRNFGHNYGCLFAAFGVAGLVMPYVNGRIQDATGKPDYSYILIISLLALGAIIAVVTWRLGPPKLKLK